MKHLSIILLVTLFSLASNEAGAARWTNPFTKERKISRHYNVSPSDKVSIDNQFGKVHINTWDKNEVTVDILISVTYASESRAQEILDDIKVDEDATESAGHDLSFVTRFPKIKSLTAKDFSVDYTINMPRKNPLDVTDKFGDVFVGDFEGRMQMDVSYGALKTQRLSGPDKRIKVAFGSVDIASAETGNFNISFSGLNIDEAGNIVVLNKFGKSTINTVKQLDINQSYGDLEVGKVDRINGTIEYAGGEIDRLNQSADLTLKYCGKVTFGSIGAGVDYINLKASYSTLRCHFEENADLNLDVKATYSTVKNQVFSKNFEWIQTHSGDFSSTNIYSGKFGAGHGKMSIELKYGGLTLK